MNNDRLLTRVWDKKEKKMIYQGDKFRFRNKEYIFNACDNECIYGVRSEKGHLNGLLLSITFSDRFIPMQCSGLKDKNGKLIYGDDVYKNGYGKNSVDGLIFKIFYNVTEAAFVIQSLRSGVLNCLDIDALIKKEIIGNIHENPELMEESK